MRRTLLVAFSGVLMLAAGFGGTSVSRAANGVAVQVQVSDWTFTPGGKPVPRTRSFSLTCEPAGGTLPLAEQVCAIVAAHPSAMLGPERGRSTCGGVAFGANLSVTATADGVTRSFGGMPMCSWPVGTTLQVYYEAVQGNAAALARATAILHCGEEPALLADPTPWGDVTLCLDPGFVAPVKMPSAWEIVQLAQHAPELHALKPWRLFPKQIGTQRCAIPVGGAHGKTVRGYCGFSVRSWRTMTVRFVEKWPLPSGKLATHAWYLTLGSVPWPDDVAASVRVESQTGPVPPQL